jgi:hypothetical protein
MRQILLFTTLFLWSYLTLAQSETNGYQLALTSSTSDPVYFLNSWKAIVEDEQDEIPIQIPTIFDNQAERVLLKTDFEIPDSLRESNLEIHFNGIRGFASISLNKNLILAHPDYPSPFSIIIPAEWVKTSGKNYLEISISESKSKTEALPNYVHIFQPASNLAITGEVFITWKNDIHYRKFKYFYNNNDLNISYSLFINHSDTLKNGNFKKLRFEEVFKSLDGTIVSKRFEYINFRKQTKNISRIISIKNPKVWTPDSPDLYQIELSAYSGGKKLAFMTKTVGLRNLQVKRGVIYLNGQPLSIKGITYRPSIKPENLSSKQIQNDLRLIKSLGFNAVRVPNSMLHPQFADITDSLGLFFSYENGLWRVPNENFIQDQFMQMVKLISSEISRSAYQHPSLLSIGIGNEIALHEPEVQKFILILSKFLKQNFRILTHVSPIDYTQIPNTDLTDIYQINAYHDAIFSALNFINDEYSPSQPAILMGNAGFAAGHDSLEEKYKKLFGRLNSSKVISGFYLESFRDWPAYSNSSLTNNYGFYPYGLFDHNGKKRSHLEILPELLIGQQTSAYYPTSETRNKTNFFSLAVFIASVVFFLIYRQNFRLRDNIKRSLSHSYGFFVDLRDRRIIALLNSFIIGLFSNLLVANIIAAYMYYFRDSIYIEELMLSILSPFGLDGLYIQLIQSPFLLLMVIWSLFFLGQIVIAFLLKVINIFSEEKIRFKQTVAVCNWAGVPLLFLIPVSLITYQIIIPTKGLHYILLIVMIVFFIWYNFRLANGIRVLMIMQSLKVFSVLVLTYSIVFFIFFAFLESKTDFFGYINLLTQGKLLLN